MMFKSRSHLFEFEDLPWLPSVFRRTITDLLAYQINRFGIYDAAVNKVQAILEKTAHTRLVDLCSGSGGPALALREKVSTILGRDIHLSLTDKYPNQVFADAKNPFVDYISQPVDAMAVPSHMEGVRTLFTAFHHFKPRDAQCILQNAVNAQMPIAIFEITERKAASLMTLLMAPLTCLIFSLFMRPRQWSRFFWTYLIPVIPLLYTWDGLISNFRSYTKEEWLQMTQQLEGNDFHWEVGKLMSQFPIQVSYLIGYPMKRSACGSNEQPLPGGTL